MPRIPIYERQYTIPAASANVPQNVESAGVVGEAVRKVGVEGFSEISRWNDIILKHAEKMKLQDDAAAAQRISTAYDNELIAFENEEKNRPGLDSYGSQDRLKQWNVKQREIFVDGLKENPTLQNAVQKHIDTRTFSLARELSTHEAAQRKTAMADSLEQTFETEKRMAYLGYEPLENSINRLNDAVLSQYDLNALGAEEHAVSYLAKKQSGLAEMFLKGLVNRNPLEAIELIKSGNLNQYLSAEKLNKFDAAAKKLGDSERVTTFFGALSAEHTNVDGSLNYDKIFRAAQDPAVFGQYQVTAEQAGQVANLFASQKARFDGLKKERQDKAADDYIPRIFDKKENPATLVADLQRDIVNQVIDRHAGEKYIEHLSKPPVTKTSPATYLDGIEKMYDTSLSSTDKRTWLVRNIGDLSEGDFKHLSNVGLSQGRTNEKTAIKSGIDTIKATLITPGMNSQTQRERLDRAVKLYESGVEQFRDVLNTPEKVAAYAGTILKMREFLDTNPMDDMKADLKKMRGVGLGKEQAAPSWLERVTGTSKTVTIDGKEYRDGDVITKDGKQFRVKVK